MSKHNKCDTMFLLGVFIMSISDINRALAGAFTLSPISMTEWQIKNDATFQNGEELKIYLINEKNKWYLTDKKETLKYMNNMYDLKAPDVKNCIAAVIRIYGFSIKAGSLTGEVIDEVQLLNVIFNYIMCIGQLANMYAFFDKPE